MVVEDADHVFRDDYGTWDASDRIEVHSQGTAAGGTGWYGINDIAQHYMTGPNTLSGSWAAWAADGGVIDPDAGFEYAAVVEGSTIRYEIGVTQFDYYGGISGGQTIVSSLFAGKLVGFDIIVSTRWDSGFGMYAENLMTNKFQDAGQFAKYTLVDTLSVVPAAGDLDEDGDVDLFDVILYTEEWLGGVFY